MNFTGNINMDMMCSCCSDKNNARIKLDSAKRILNNLKRMVDEREILSFRNTREHSEYMRMICNSHNHVHFMCGTCRQVKTMELYRVEEELNEYLGAFILYIKSIDTNKAKSLKRDLFDLFRGHYPIAARLIDRTELKGDVV